MRRLRLLWRDGALALAACLAAATLAASGVLAPIDDALYAAYVRNSLLARDGATVLIAIDDRSLQQLGQWPWPRRVHARLLDRLTAAGARSVALDVLMPERDRDAGGDAPLAAAMRTNGRVVLPVNAGTPAGNAPVEELVPVAPLAGAARALGHTDLGPAAGSAPSLYLAAGVGAPRWPALPLALLGVERGEAAASRVSAAAASRAWERADRVLLRFAGPAGTYPQYAYADVLDGRVPGHVFRDRRVIVGATATGLGHVVATPMRPAAMSTLEYVANATETLARQAAVRPLRPAAGALLAVLLTALLAAVSLRMGRRARLLTGLAAIAATLVASVVALPAANAWWGPSAAIASMAMLVAGSLVLELRRSGQRAELDGVTGLMSRRRFLRHLRSAVARAAGSGEGLAVVSVEIAGLDAYRARTGELEAAVLLERLARAALAELRGAGDFAGRTSEAGVSAVIVGRPDAAVDEAIERLREQIGRFLRSARDASGGTALHVHVGRAFASDPVAGGWLPLLRRAAEHGRVRAEFG